MHQDEMINAAKNSILPSSSPMYNCSWAYLHSDTNKEIRDANWQKLPNLLKIADVPVVKKMFTSAPTLISQMDALIHAYTQNISPLW